MLGTIGVLLVVAVVVAVVLVVVGMRAPEARDPIQARLAEFSVREEPLSLEEIELSQGFYDPIVPSFFLPLRIILAVVFGGLIFIVFLVTGRNWVQGLALTVVFLLLGFMFPDRWLSSRISRRQKGVFRAMPDALDLLTVCVEAGLGFDAAMSKVQEKWDNELSLEFGRVIQEIRLGKLRRDALRDMAERIGVAELTSFVAAVIQSEQLGVSLAKVLRIQSDQMRVRRRQMAEEVAHQAPIKMIFPIALLIFPSILIVLLGPAALLLMSSTLGSLLMGR